MKNTSWSTENAKFDRDHIWHPYDSMVDPFPAYPVVEAQGVRLNLADGRVLIDGMASWWSAIHGYNHTKLNQALNQQISCMAHVMFGGLTHLPAVELCKRLVDITPDSLDKVFLSDSGSVAVEVALKMAIQFWQVSGLSKKQRFLSLSGGYHGDTLGAMSVCDPVTGMHHLFNGHLPTQLFAPIPRTRFDADWDPEDGAEISRIMDQHHQEIAAVILEPVVQGAGGMRFYHPEFVRTVRDLCDHYDVLLIVDEIATGFGRTGKLFACEHAGITPDIMCLGKALTGGYLTLAATLTHAKLAQTVSSIDGAGCLMHGPTFMANPLACSVAVASINLLLSGNWQENVRYIQDQLERGLAPCRSLGSVADVRVLGGIGVVEMQEPVDIRNLTEQFVAAGVWLRPFGKLVYMMPPYIIGSEDISQLTGAVVGVLTSAQSKLTG